MARAPDLPVTNVTIPARRLGPIASILVRVAVSVLCLVVCTVIVYLGRAGYRDNGTGEPLTWLAALYYSTVSLSTTGYGDITPVSDAARWMNIIVITPLRLLFLIVLVGTTIEVLTQRGRQELRIDRWRKSVRDHTIVIGFGVKGRSTVETLLENGTPHRQIVVVSENPTECADAARMTIVAVHGDARRESTLQEAGITRAASVVIAADRDDTAVLIALTVRRLAGGRPRVVAAARESDNADVLRQSGVDAVIMTAESAGRLMGLSLESAYAASLMEDLLDPGRGLEVVERPITASELGQSPDQLRVHGLLVLATVRDGVPLRFDEGKVRVFQTGDRIVVIQSAPSGVPHRGATVGPAST